MEALRTVLGSEAPRERDPQQGGEPQDDGSFVLSAASAPVSPAPMTAYLRGVLAAPPGTVEAEGEEAAPARASAIPCGLCDKPGVYLCEDCKDVIVFCVGCDAAIHMAVPTAALHYVRNLGTMELVGDSERQAARDAAGVEFGRAGPDGAPLPLSPRDDTLKCGACNAREGTVFCGLCAANIQCGTCSVACHAAGAGRSHLLYDLTGNLLPDQPAGVEPPRPPVAPPPVPMPAPSPVPGACSPLPCRVRPSVCVWCGSGNTQPLCALPRARAVPLLACVLRAFSVLDVRTCCSGTVWAFLCAC